MVVTIAVRLPACVGLVENETVMDVGVADMTVPTAPIPSDTLLLETTGSKP